MFWGLLYFYAGFVVEQKLALKKHLTTVASAEHHLHKRFNFKFSLEDVVIAVIVFKQIFPPFLFRIVFRLCPPLFLLYVCYTPGLTRSYLGTENPAVFSSPEAFQPPNSFDKDTLTCQSD